MIRLFESINKYCLYLLVFSVTFENWDPFKLVGTYSITYLASILYIGTWIPLMQNNFNFRIFKKYVIPLLLFIFIGFISTGLHVDFTEELKHAYKYRVLLLIVLMVLIASQISNSHLLINKVLSTYIASILFIFLLVSLGMGTDYEKGRLLLFGENPNILGMKSVIAFLIVVARMMDSTFNIKQLLITILLSFPLLSLVILSGSRGAFLSIFLGLSVLIFFKNIGLIKKFFLIATGVVASVFFFSYVMQNNPVIQKRMINSIETGDTGRNELWVGAVQIIENNLFIGVGFTGVLPEMYKYSGIFKDPHNVFLYVLISTGVIGFFFFMVFIWRLFWNQLRAYKQTGQTVYLVIYTIILMNMAKTGGGIGKILFWFFFAILIAAAEMDQNNSKSDLIN